MYKSSLATIAIAGVVHLLVATGHWKIFHYTSIATIALAGVVHLLIAPEHFPHHLAHGTFFILIGIAQLVWAVSFWRYASPRLYWTGLAVSGGPIIWVLAQLVLLPFAPAAEVLDPSVVVSKSSELIGFVALVALIGRGQLEAYTKWSVARLIGAALVIALVFATWVWGGGHLAEVTFPGLGHAERHDLNNKQAHDVADRPTPTPTPGPTPDLQLMIAAAVEAALAARSTPPPTPGPNPDLQNTITAAVEAALADRSAPPSTPDPTPDLQDRSNAANEQSHDDGTGHIPIDDMEPIQMSPSAR